MKGPGMERSGVKWRSGEGLLLARGLCSFGFLPVASDEGEGDGPQPRNINTLNSLSTPAGLGHMLTSHNYGFTTFVHREGELSCERERERERGWFTGCPILGGTNLFPPRTRGNDPYDPS